MVTAPACWCLLTTAWIVAERGRAGIDRLDPATRAKVLAALTALVILGFGMVALAWLGARMTRRYMRRFDVIREDRWRASTASQDDWAEQPIVPRTEDRPQQERENPGPESG